ncbi:hypothetical protein Droror1_Dr00016398 [Drosera rotundifolia]
MEQFSSNSTLLIVFLIVSLIICIPIQTRGEIGFGRHVKNGSDPMVPAILVFGDSTMDPGNNDYIATTFRSNFAPYGRDFANHEATGRFTNGRLVTDFVASYLGIKKYVPAYLDLSLSDQELLTGVSFASGGNGYDPLTPQLSGVISMQRQLEYFKEYKSRIEKLVGGEKADYIVKSAGYVISAGTNDFVVNYYSTTLPVRRNTYSVGEYQKFLLQNVQEFIQGLWKEGSRKMAVVGLPPMGCLPDVITTNSRSIFQGRECVESLSSISREYNQQFQSQLDVLQRQFAAEDQNTKLAYIDIYTPIANMVQEPSKYGFEEVNRGCCGTGYVETIFLCNPISTTCTDDSKYVFFDAIHPTEKAYNIIFQYIRPVIDSLVSS